MRNRCFFFSLLLKTFSSVPLVFVLCFTFCTIGLLAQQSVQVNADGQLSYLVDERETGCRIFPMQAIRLLSRSSLMWLRPLRFWRSKAMLPQEFSRPLTMCLL